MEMSTQVLSDRWNVSPRQIRKLAEKYKWEKGELHLNGNVHRTFDVSTDQIQDLDSYYSSKEPIFEDALQAFGAYSHYIRSSKQRCLVKEFKLGDTPVGITCIGDIHIGSHEVDYNTIRKQTKIITRCEGMYATQHGDIMNNMLMRRLTDVGALKDESIKHQYKIVKEYLYQIKDSLLFGISGNHEQFSERKVGIDPQAQIYESLNIPYHKNEALITFKVGNCTYRMHTRHQFSGSSKYHPWRPNINLFFHGDHSPWNDRSPHIVITGHTHSFGYAEVELNGLVRLLLTIGSYKTDDSYAQRLGFTDALPIMPCIILNPKKYEWVLFKDLEEAEDYLIWLRK